jgi:tyrosyl-tRNA synthetase
MPILEGLDGVQKMSKSLGNAIGIHEAPQEMYGKVMSISDEMMWRFYELLTDMSMDKIESLRQQCENGAAHPMKVKQALAEKIVSDFHSAEAGGKAAADWSKQFQKDEVPEDVETVEMPYGDIAGTVASDKTVKLEKVLFRSGLAESVSDGVRKIKQNSVKINGVTKSDSPLRIEELPFEATVRVGRRLKRIVISK